MSIRLLSRSADLQHLLEEGYELQFRSQMLLMHVPYVNRAREVAWGWIVSTLEQDPTTEGTSNPIGDHTAHFIGATGAADDQPCDSEGNPLVALMNNPNGPIQVVQGIDASCCFSQKPPSGQYSNYYDKLTTYALIFVSEVHAIDPDVEVPTFAPVDIQDDLSVHRYFDSATSRARIGAVVAKTEQQRLAVVGVGGSGSYVLDALVKTHAAEIHIYDADEFLPHNAFRMPGAASLERLQDRPLKVEYHHQVYDALHRAVVPHPYEVNAESIEELRAYSFVFLCIDASPTKRVIVEKLIEFGVPFVDTGMGIKQTGDALGGQLRTTRIVPGTQHQEWSSQLSFVDESENDYDQNIQIAELNMLNAAHAVLAWKKYIGYYRDIEMEVESLYVIDGNRLMNGGGVSAQD